MFLHSQYFKENYYSILSIFCCCLFCVLHTSVSHSQKPNPHKHITLNWLTKHWPVSLLITPLQTKPFPLAIFKLCFVLLHSTANHSVLQVDGRRNTSLSFNVKQCASENSDLRDQVNGVKCSRCCEVQLEDR